MDREAVKSVLREQEIEVIESQRYVSRGGIKLANALDTLGLDVTGLECLDVGASTGGFTDCLIQRGAKHVISLDVAPGGFSSSTCLPASKASRII